MSLLSLKWNISMELNVNQVSASQNFLAKSCVTIRQWHLLQIDMQPSQSCNISSMFEPFSAHQVCLVFFHSPSTYLMTCIRVRSGITATSQKWRAGLILQWMDLFPLSRGVQEGKVRHVLVTHVVNWWTDTLVTQLGESEKNQLIGLVERVHKRVVAQGRAVELLQKLFCNQELD